PFRRADFALIAEVAAARPPAALPDEIRGALDLPLVGVARLDHGYRQAVRAEDEVDIVNRGAEPGEHFVPGCHERAHEIWVLRVFAHEHHLRPPAVARPEGALPLVEAAAGGGLRILRIERHENDLLGRVTLEFRDRFACEWMPVAHRDYDSRIDISAQLAFERGGLAGGELA